ncbi:hypothetical protein K2W90_01790 [Candidatus Babeliales bacterium]|nr:hypothetical protein [Candidatus Babeliales bacterium]
MLMSKNSNSKTLSRVLILCGTIFLAACFPKQQISQNSHVPLFIPVPLSKFTFRDISTLIYQSMSDHCARVGHTLVTQAQNGYSLHIEVKDLSSLRKFVSPDVLLFHTTVRLELACSLYNFTQELIAQKTFHFSTLISKARNPIINSSFLTFEYKQLMNQAAPKIERYFRRFLKKDGF